MRLLFAFFCFLCAPSWATLELSPEEIEAKLKAYSQLTAFRAPFKQVKKLKEMGVELTSEGELTVRRPDRVVWKVTKPSPLTMTLTPKEISLTHGEREQRWRLGQEVPEEAARGIQQLLAWLKLDAREIAKNFRMIQETGDSFLCIPRSFENEKTSPFKSFRLFLTKKGHLDKLVLEERSNDTLEIRFAEPSKIE